MNTQKQARQQYGEVHESEALRIPEEKAEQLVDALNTDLAATYVLYHQIKKHHWLVEGAEFHDIHEYLDEVATDLEDGADMLAERAQALGGVPLSGGANYEEHAPITPEDADAYDIRTSLEHDLELFGDVTEQLRDARPARDQPRRLQHRRAAEGGPRRRRGTRPPHRALPRRRHARHARHGSNRRPSTSGRRALELRFFDRHYAA